MDGESLRLAVLIDGDNIAAEAMDRLFAIIATLGDPVVRIVYRAQTLSKKWQQAADRHALCFGRRHPHLTGNNATDIEMVIGAMDLLMCVTVDGFCLVSSDADFTSLAIRLRESGKRVFGFGGKKAPESLRRACERFFPIEQGSKPEPKGAPASNLSPEKAIALLRGAFETCATDGWAGLPDAANSIWTRNPNLSAKSFGPSGLKKFIETSGAFELVRRHNRDLFRPLQPSLVLKLVNPQNAG